MMTFRRARSASGLFTRATASLLLFMFLWPMAGVARDLTRQVQFDIGPQPLSVAIIQFSKQADVQVLASAQKLDGVSTKGVRGRHSIDDGLKILLDATGFRSRVSANNVILLTPSDTSDQSKPVGDKGGQAANPTVLAQAQSAERREASGENVQRVESITVTATKREERFMDVPMSLGLVTKSEIERRGLTSSEDYLRGMPGVNQVATSYNSGQSIVIRGIETTPSAQNFGVGPVYASYFGETPTTTSASVSGGTSVDVKVVDVDRVEVLRGPQGTAFGDASLGGAVRIIPTAPKLNAFEGKVNGELSSTARLGGINYNLQGMLNVPIVQDRIAIRGVAYEYTESGYYRNRAGSDATFRAGPVTQFGAQAYAVDKDDVGETHVRGGRLAALFSPSNDLRFTLNLLSQRNEQNGIPLANSGKYDQTLFQVHEGQVIRGKTGGYSDQYIRIVNPVLELKTGWGDFVATFSSTRSGSTNAEPFALFGSNLPLSQAQPSHQDGRIGEIRFVSRFEGSFNFLAGLFAEKLEDDAEITFFWFGSPESNNFARGTRGNVGTAIIHRELTQKSVFAEVNWRVLPNLVATAGTRYYDYDRPFSDVRSGPVLGNSNFAGTVTATGTSPRANVSYHFHEDALVYAGYSEGFRLGTPQPPLPARCDANGDGIVDGTSISMASTGTLTSDTIKNYEIGAKASFGSVAVDGALFHMAWEGVPVRVLAPAPPVGCLLSFQANAGNAQSDGIELNAIYQISRNWRASLGASWAHARLTNDVPALNARAGNQLPGAPKYNASIGLQYDFELRGYRSFARLDAIYLGPSYGDLLESPRLKADAYAKLDLTAGMKAGRLDLGFFVRNVTNEDAFTGRGTNAAVPELYGYRLRPRTIGLRLGYSF
jgi:iron complex outermembrane recepter protein